MTMQDMYKYMCEIEPDLIPFDVIMNKFRWWNCASEKPIDRRWYIMFLFMVLMFLILIGADTSEYSLPMAILAVLVFFSPGWICFLIIVAWKKHAKKKTNMWADMAMQKAAEIHAKIPFLPEVYCYPDIIRITRDYIVQGRVQSVQEMLNLYELEAHQRRMEAASQEIIELQMQQIDATNRAAAATIATGLYRK